MNPIKIWTIFLLTFFINTSIKAQSTNLTLGVILPTPTSNLNSSQIQKIGTKITQIINNSNQATVGYNNDFVVYPVISVDETGTVEGGMQNITVTTLDFSLFVKQISTNLVYNTISKKLKGSGDNISQSISNGLNQIKTNDELFVNFISTAKMKIINYYNNNCKLIIQKADNLDYEEGISSLQSIPSVCNLCYNAAQRKSIEIYKKYQTILCTKNINKANGEIAINNFSSAIELLEMIDPTSTCSGEAKQLIAQISNKVEGRRQEELNLEKFRINAVKEIAKAYFSRTVNLVNYNVIIR